MLFMLSKLTSLDHCVSNCLGSFAPRNFVTDLASGLHTLTAQDGTEEYAKGTWNL